MRKIRVLIVDDSVVIRRMLTEVISSDPACEVVGAAANGRIGLAKIEQLRPDLVTLDVEMPEMDGLATLTAIRKIQRKLPVIMFSSLTEKGASTTLEALSLGATDYVTKPSGSSGVSGSCSHVRQQLLPKILALCGAAAGVSKAPEPATQCALPRRPPSLVPAGTTPSLGVDVVAIGCSTGGPNALAEIFAKLPGDLPVPIVITQHMPPLFTKLLADRLTSTSKVRIHEAVDQQVVERGHAYLAPGDFHMRVVRSGAQVRIALEQGPPENSCRPAVDVMFRSVAALYGGRTLAVVLTGMGQDGLRGCEHIAEQGGEILAQDDASSVVWGMPGFVARAGLANAIVPLKHMESEIVRRVLRGARALTTTKAGERNDETGGARADRPA